MNTWTEVIVYGFSLIEYYRGLFQVLIAVASLRTLLIIVIVIVVVIHAECSCEGSTTTTTITTNSGSSVSSRGRRRRQKRYYKIRIRFTQRIQIIYILCTQSESYRVIIAR